MPAAAWLLLLPIAAGAGVMFASGAPASRYAVQLASGVAGLLLAVAIPRVRKLPPRVGAGLAALAVVAVGAPLVVGASVEGVRRWIEIGAFRVHPSMLLTPPLLVFTARRLERRPWVGHAILIALQVAHALAPDAGMATAVGAAAIALTLAGDPPRRVWMTPVYGASIALAWLRPDPLGPAPFVEDIVARAFALSPIVGGLGLVALGCGALGPLMSRGSDRSALERATAVALATYFVGLAVVPLVGAFPVPLLGFGASPVIGAFLGMAAFDRARRAPAASEAEEAPRAARENRADQRGRLAWRS